MVFDADLHLHGKYSGGVSPDMELAVLSREAKKKGLDLVGTGDILNPKWLSHAREELDKTGDGVYSSAETDFVLTTELEDENRVHHILIFPSFQSVKDSFNDFKTLSNDIRREGRPRIKAGGEKIVEIAKKHGCLVGPAHAFTPYTAIYGKHDSLRECYGAQTDNLDFLELGLSADTSMASRISDHSELVFLSNSDAHSPWPHRLGREFNRINADKTFQGLEKLFDGRKGEVKLNVGLDPREGKYHCSACNSCHQKYSLGQAEQFNWRCQECGSPVKKGVKDRVNELADQETEDGRPEYYHLPPLANIIQQVVGHSSPTTKTVQQKWKQFNSEHGSEIEILVEKSIEELEKTDVNVAGAIKKFRNDQTVMIPGGGGNYGELIIPENKAEKQRIESERSRELNCRY